MESPISEMDYYKILGYPSIKRMSEELSLLEDKNMIMMISSTDGEIVLGYNQITEMKIQSLKEKILKEFKTIYESLTLNEQNSSND